MTLQNRLRSIKLDTWLLVVAVADCWHLWYLFAQPCYGVVCPWYSDLVWYSTPHRLLVAAIGFRFRRWWSELAGLLLAVPLVLGQLFYNCNPLSLSIYWSPFEEDGYFFFLRFLQSPQFQGILALILSLALFHRLSGRLPAGRLRRSIQVAAGLAGTVLIIGYTSNFVSCHQAGVATARWLVDEEIKENPVYCCYPDDPGRQESGACFREAGAIVLDPAPAVSDPLPWAEVIFNSFPGPFLIQVRYRYEWSDYPFDSIRSGDCLVAACFGRVVVLDRQSYIRLPPYCLFYPF